MGSCKEMELWYNDFRLMPETAADLYVRRDAIIVERGVASQADTHTTETPSVIDGPGYRWACFIKLFLSPR